MNKYYFIFPQTNRLAKQQYVIITAESEDIAKSVFEILYRQSYARIIINHFIAGNQYQLLDTVTQRLTE